MIIVERETGKKVAVIDDERIRIVNSKDYALIDEERETGKDEKNEK